MKLSTILALLPFCAALPIEGTSVKTLGVSSPLVPRQAGAAIEAAMEAAFSWAVEGEEATVDAEIEIAEDGTVTPAATAAGANVVVIEHIPSGPFKQFLYVAIRKIDNALGLEGHAAMYINRATGRLVGNPTNLGLTSRLRGRRFRKVIVTAFRGSAKVKSF